MTMIIIRNLDHPIINFLQNKKIGYIGNTYGNELYMYIIDMKDYPALGHRSAHLLINGMVDILKHYGIDAIGS